jgi:hypothetical protein
LGKSLDIPVIAEGMETKQQLDFLRSAECEEVQGFYFGRPATAEQIRGLIEASCAQVQAPERDAGLAEKGSRRSKFTPILGARPGPRPPDPRPFTLSPRPVGLFGPKFLPAFRSRH